MMLTNLDNKIAELKSQLNESKKLKEDAEKLLLNTIKSIKKRSLKLKKLMKMLFMNQK